MMCLEQYLAQNKCFNLTNPITDGNSPSVWPNMVIYLHCSVVTIVAFLVISIDRLIDKSIDAYLYLL